VIIEFFLPPFIGEVLLFIGLLVLFTLGSLSYFISLKDVAEDLNREFEPNLKKCLPIILFIVIGLPISIVLLLLQVETLILMIGLAILLVFVSIMYYWGMKLELEES
jgi:NhaP-type Na+/H+ or K+/H+ antiporter